MTRTQNVLMSRVRETQYELLTMLAASSLLRGVTYLHLKKGLEVGQVDWYRCPNPSTKSAIGALTPHGIRRDVQERLAALRTDLDAFSNVEADALMLSGYQMARDQFANSITSIPVSNEPPVRWRFQGIQEIACATRDTPELSTLLRALEVGAKLAFKPFLVSKKLLITATLLASGSVAFLIYVVWRSWTAPVVVEIERWMLIAAISTVPFLLLAKIVGRWIARRTRYRAKPQRIMFAILICLGGFAVVRAMLRLTEPFFLQAGPKYKRVPYSSEEIVGR